MTVSPKVTKKLNQGTMKIDYIMRVSSKERLYFLKAGIFRKVSFICVLLKFFGALSKLNKIAGALIHLFYRIVHKILRTRSTFAKLLLLQIYYHNTCKK